MKTNPNTNGWSLVMRERRDHIKAINELKNVKSSGPIVLEECIKYETDLIV